MRKLLFIGLFFITTSVMAQSEKYSYCQLVGTANLLGKITVTIDYGQEAKWFSDQRVKDESGKTVKFNSMVDALNYMAVDGWEHVQAYAITTGNSNVYHHLLKKKVIK